MKNKKINLERYEYLLYTVDKDFWINPFYEDEVVDILEQAISDMAFINNNADFSVDQNTHNTLFSAINSAYRLYYHFKKIKNKILEIIDNEEFIKYIDENINMVAYLYGDSFIHFIFEQSSKKEKYLKYYFKCVNKLNRMLHLNNLEDYAILRKEIGNEAVYSYISKYFWKNLFDYKNQNKMFNVYRDNHYLLDILKESLNYQDEKSITFENNHDFQDIYDFLLKFPSTTELVLKCVNIDEIRNNNNIIEINFNLSIYKKYLIIKSYERFFGKGWVFVFNELNEELIFENLLPPSQLLFFKAINKYERFNENHFYHCLKEMNERKLFKRDENGYYEITEKDLDRVITSKYI